MAFREFALGAAAAAFLAPVPRLVAQEAAPRMHVVRASDGTSVGHAEVFDLVLDVKSGVGFSRELRADPDREMPKVARRCVADGDGWFELAPGKFHAVLARAPGRYRFVDFVDAERQNGGTLELVSDEPLVIQVVDVRGDPVEGAIVERQVMRDCGNCVNTHDPWRVATGRDGRLSFPHYWSRALDEFSVESWLTLQNPVNDPPRVSIESGWRGRPTALTDEGPRLVRWQLPPLSKMHVEFVDAGTVAPDSKVTFEMVGPKQYFGVPDRYVSDHGEPIELLTETGVPWRACFHWRERDPGRRVVADLLAFGSAHPVEGGCALLRVPLASDPVALRLRPVRDDGATFLGVAIAGAKVHKFEVSLQWFDPQGFRLCSSVHDLVPDETGTLRFSWPRPRFADADRPAKLRVALRNDYHLWGWEPLETDDLVVREVDWPVGGSLDAGTFVVPGSN